MYNGSASAAAPPSLTDRHKVFYVFCSFFKIKIPSSLLRVHFSSVDGVGTTRDLGVVLKHQSSGVIQPHTYTAGRNF